MVFESSEFELAKFDCIYYIIIFSINKSNLFNNSYKCSQNIFFFSHSEIIIFTVY